MVKEKIEEVVDMDLIDEVHDRIDVLMNLLIKKGLISEKEIEEEFEIFYNKKNLDN